MFDIRGKHRNTIATGKTINIWKTSHSSVKAFLKAHFSKEFGISEDFIYVGSGDDHVVIHENVDELICFIIFQTFHSHYDFERPFYASRGFGGSLSTKALGCIGIDSGTTVRDLEIIVCNNQNFKTGKRVCLMYNDKRLEKSQLQLASFLKNGDRISCVDVREEMLQCFHIPRQNIENKYSVSCHNTNTVAEIKELFKHTFHGEFKGLESGEDQIWFTQGKHILKDEDYLFIDAKRKAQMQERGRVFVHIKPIESVPIILKINTNETENLNNILFALLPMTSQKFREDVSIYTKHPPNSLQLYLKTGKIREVLLSEDTGFVANCIVTVKVKNEIMIFVDVKHGTNTNTMKLNVYKLDAVTSVKKTLVGHLKCDVRDLQITFQGQTLTDEAILQDYRIRSGDTIHVRLYHDSIHLLIRQPGERPKYLTVNNHRKFTVFHVKMYLSQKNHQTISKMNILFHDRCLADEDTLEESGLTSGSTIVLTRFAQSDGTARGDIQTVFFAHTDGTLQAVLATRAGGMLFYAPESVTDVTNERNQLIVTGSTDNLDNFDQDMMMREVIRSESITSNKPAPSTLLQTVTYQTLRMTGPPVTTANQLLFASRSTTQVSNNMSQGRPTRLKYSTSEPIFSGYHSDPEFNTLKRFTYCKELAEGQGRIILREQSFYEEDVSKKHPDERFLSSSPSGHLQSPERTVDSQQLNIQESPRFFFPTEAVQNPILQSVSLELGHNWKRLALVLGLSCTEIENIEYRHSRNLHDQAMQALILWKQRQSKNATTARLKEALIQCELALIADSINENLKYETT